MPDSNRTEAPPAPFVPEADIVPPRAPVVPEPSFEMPPAQLDLDQEEVRLPWLEGDDEFQEERGSMGQGVLLAVLGLVAMCLIAGFVFWLTRDKAEELVADGGVISAPKEPYKVRPDNPGGEVVAGTGDTSFAVAEGEQRQTRIGGGQQGANAPAQGFSSVGPVKPGGAPSATPSEAPSEAPVSGVGVQVGAYASKEQAEAGWNTLKSQYPGLGVVHHRILQGQADIGTVYRLQAVPGDAAAARALCSGMKGAGLSCQVKN